MVNLDTLLDDLELGARVKVVEALEILVTHEVFVKWATMNMNRLVAGRTDSDDEVAIAKEVRDIRQTNRVLLGLHESARQLFKEQSNENE